MPSIDSLPPALRNSSTARDLVGQVNSANGRARAAKAELAMLTSPVGFAMQTAAGATVAGVAGAVDARIAPIEIGQARVPVSVGGALVLIGVAIGAKSKLAAEGARGIIYAHAYRMGHDKSARAA